MNAQIYTVISEHGVCVLVTTDTPFIVTDDEAEGLDTALQDAVTSVMAPYTTS